MFFKRLIRVIQLDPQVFLEVSDDKSSLAPAIAVAFLSNVAAGVGGVGGHVRKIPLAIVFAFSGWIIWAVSIYLIGAKLFPAQKTSARLSAVFSVVGFASAPGFLKLLAFFPPFSAIVTLGATFWMFGTTLVAAQKALHYQSLPRTIGVVFVGWVVYQWFLITI